uniref:D-isomer specific 2-hydroxyacid dehydrogenase NAD-binding domain-containing protein n=1 Tax=Tetradesmus obliquus TaxID=3088 RepID=A0A383VF37_TETOB|eukprot:jgi/Sobl393_1/9936/SZX63540.1
MEERDTQPAETTPITANIIVARYPPAPPASTIAELLNARLPPGVTLLGCGQSPAELQHLTQQQWASADVLIVWGARNPNAKEFYAKLTGLKWLHSVATGLELWLTPEVLSSSVTITNAKGVTANSMAEFAMMCCHYFSRQLPRLLEAQAAHRWDVFEVEELRGATLGLVGCGHIGRRVAQLGGAYGMRVVALRSNPALSQPDVDSGLLDRVYSPEHLHEVMACSDYVVVSTPYTPDTHELISAAAIAAMKPTAVLINVGRGRCMDEAALIEALQAGRIRGAGLDVYQVEPLPPSSPLWGLPNVLLSPHRAAFHSNFFRDSVDLFARNLQRHLAGQPLLNVLDKQSQY